MSGAHLQYRPDAQCPSDRQLEVHSEQKSSLLNPPGKDHEYMCMPGAQVSQSSLPPPSQVPQPNKRTSSRTRTMSPLEAATETEERVTIDNIGRIHARMIRYEHTTRVPVYRTRGGPSWLRLRTGFPPLVVDVSPQMPRLLRTDRRTDTTRGRPAFADCRWGGLGGCCCHQWTRCWRWWGRRHWGRCYRHLAGPARTHPQPDCQCLVPVVPDHRPAPVVHRRTEEESNKDGKSNEQVGSSTGRSI
eukprot:284830-Pyramimonas_sp.AAC.1